MRKFLISFIFSLLLAGCTFNLIPDPNASLLPTVTPVPEVVPEVVPAEEVGEVVPDPTPVPPCEIVKGNINRAGEKIYFTEESINFKNVKIDEAAGEKFFCSEDEAVAAGWRKALR